MSTTPFGVNVIDQPGRTLATRETGAVLFVVGAAPVHMLDEEVTAPVNVPVVCRTMAEFQAAFGIAPAGDEADYSLTVAADVLFNRYRVAPVVFVNVFDPATVAHQTEGDPDVSKVSAANVAGADDGAGNRTGIEVIEEVFTTTGLVPTLLLAPYMGHQATVAAALRAKAASYSRSFRAEALLDVSTAAGSTAAAITAKTTAGSGGAALADPFAVYCFPQVQALLPDGSFRAEPLSLHVAGAIASAAADNGGVSVQSPSNRPLQAARPALTLALQDVEALRKAGIVTVQRFGPGGYRIAGNRTSAFLNGEPTADTVEEGMLGSFISARLVANHVANQLVLDTLRIVDNPTSRAQIDRVLDGARRFGNSLLGLGGTLGFSADFLSADNPAQQLADGHVVFRLTFLPPPPMERIDFLLSVELGYFAALTA